MGLFGTRLEATAGKDDRWLRSSFGHDAGLPVTLKLSAFANCSVTGADGSVRIPSGIPLACHDATGAWLEDDHSYAPYGGDPSAQLLAGFLKGDIEIPAGYSGSVGGALLYAAVVDTGMLPFGMGSNVTLADVKAGNCLVVLVNTAVGSSAWQTTTTTTVAANSTTTTTVAATSTTQTSA